MIRHILIILAILYETSSFAQVTLDEVNVVYFDKGLHLHLVSSPQKRTQMLLDDVIANQERIISENLSEYPYKTEMSLMHLNDIQDQSMLLDLVKKEVKLKNYERSRDILQLIDPLAISKEFKIDYQFYKGYLKFVHKDFSGAKKIFDNAESIKGKYKYESIYYSAFCDLFNENYSSAFESFSQVKNQKGINQDIPYYLALSKYQLEEYQQVIAILNPVSNRSSGIYQEAMKELLSRAYYKESKWDQLSEILITNEKCCESPEQHYFAGMSEYKRGNFQNAITHLNEATHLNTEESQNALLAIGSIYAKDHPKLAIPILEEAAAMNYNANLKDQATLSLAKIYQRLDKSEKLLRLIKRIPTESDLYVETLKLKYQAEYKKGNYEEALTTMLSSPSIDDPLLYQELQFRTGKNAYDRKEDKNAIEHLNICSQLANNKDISSKAAYLLAKIYFNQKDWDKFNSALKQVQKQGTTNLMVKIDLHYMSGNSELEANAFEEAIDHFNQAEYDITQAFKIKASDQLEILYEDVLIRKADSHFKLGQKEKALRAYEIALDYSMNRGDYVMYQIGKLEDLSGENFLQISTYESLQKKYPNSKYTIDARVKKGEAYVKIGKSKEAFDEFMAVYESPKSLSSQKLKSLLRLGLLTYNQGDLDEALKYYKMVVAQESTQSTDRTQALLAIQEIYLNDYGDSAAYYGYMKSIKTDVPMNLNKDSIDYSIAMEAFGSDKDAGLLKLEGYLSSHPLGKERINVLKEIAKYHEVNEKYEKAIESYEQLLKESPSSSQLATIRIIHNLSKTKDYQRYVDYNIAVINSDYSDQLTNSSYANVAKASTKMTKMAQYAKYISLAVKGNHLTHREKERIQLQLAKEYFLDKNYNDFKNLLSFLVKSEDDEIAAESYLLLSQRLIETKNYQDALQTTQIALDKNSSQKEFIGRVLITQSQIFIAQDDLDDAEAALSTIISQSDLPSSTLKKADELMNIIKSKRESQRQLENPTLTFQYTTHE